MNKRVVVLVSGMDSVVALEKARLEYPGYEVIGVYYDMGQSFSKAEISKLPAGIVIRRFRGYLRMLDSSEVDGYVYYSEMFEGILHDAIRTYQPDILWLGILRSDSRNFSDNSLDWVTVFSDKFPRTEIDYPLARMGLGKKEVVEYGIKLGLDPKVLINMHHCRSKFYGENGCGSCFSCMRKKSVFEELGYETKIPSPKKMPTYLLSHQMAMYAESYMKGEVSSEDFEFMNEIVPLLESEYGIKDDIFKLEKAIQANYEERKYIVEELMEDYDE